MNKQWMLLAPVTLLLGATHAQAQSAAPQGAIKPSPVAPSLNRPWQLFPAPKPQPAITPSPSLQIRVLQVSGITVYHLESTGKSLGEILECIAAAADVHAVVDPLLRQHNYKQLNLTALSLSDLLLQAAKEDNRTETLQTASGTYFFAETNGERFFNPQRGLDPHIDPFNKFNSTTKKVEPKPEWGKIPFNGDDVYVIPLPLKPVK